MARRIALLPPQVAERIAAGEVIERPASVVKELVENSLDAGAKEITVVLEDGGKTLIEVTDNGHGMVAEDLALAIQRHATSKLRDFDDLLRLTSLGFRGEALPSVMAVADVQITSRAEGESTAYELRARTHRDQTEPARIEGPEALTHGHFNGAPHGTRFRVHGLFSQVPARLKFLKSQGAEVAAVREWMERLALTHPGTGFRLVSDDRTVLNLRPESEASRVRSILSDGDDYPIVDAVIENPSGAPSLKSIRVYWLQGLSTPQAKRIVQAINGRAVRDRMLQQALLSPFRQALLPGQFPAVALFLDVDPSTIDVNVHPTKSEIRFIDGGKVFRAIQSLVEDMISQRGAPAFAAGASQPDAGSESPSWQAPAWQPQIQSTLPPGWSGQTWSAPQRRPFTASESSPSDSAFALTPTESHESPTQPEAMELPTPAPAHPFSGARFSGMVFNTYLIYDFGDELGLIDQHAAHERVRYEKLKKRILDEGAPLTPQQLLIPEAAHFSAEHRETLEERLPWLEKAGFEAEIFGEETLLFRAVPAEWGTDSLRIRLKNLVERVIASDRAPADGPEGNSLLLDESLFEALASEACHSAIRAGDRLRDEQAHELADQLFRCEHPWNCPHGRPTTVRVPKARLEEWFQRRV